MSQDQDDIKKILSLFDNDQQAGLARLASLMGAPLKTKMDYAGIARRMFTTEETGQSIWKSRKVDRIGDGDIPIYDKDV